MRKCREPRCEGDSLRPQKTRLISHHWLISTAWRHALNTLDLLEKEQRCVLKRSMETTGDEAQIDASSADTREHHEGV